MSNVVGRVLDRVMTIWDTMMTTTTLARVSLGGLRFTVTPVMLRIGVHGPSMVSFFRRLLGHLMSFRILF